MTLYRIAESTKEEKKTDFEILRAPEDERMLPTISKEAQRLCSLRHVKIKNQKEDHALLLILAFSISFDGN